MIGGGGSTEGGGSKTRSLGNYHIAASRFIKPNYSHDLLKLIRVHNNYWFFRFGLYHGSIILILKTLPESVLIFWKVGLILLLVRRCLIASSSRFNYQLAKVFIYRYIQINVTRKLFKSWIEFPRVISLTESLWISKKKLCLKLSSNSIYKVVISDCLYAPFITLEPFHRFA